jgi:hypothetical protein
LVVFTAPATAVPGDTFDAVVTVHALDGSFADGTVKVHAAIIVPRITVDKTTIDFGDVSVGAESTISLKFSTLDPVEVGPDAFVKAPFLVGGGGGVEGGIAWNLSVGAGARYPFGSGPGDYTTTFTWTAPASPQARPAACLWTTTTTVHARILGADVGDAGTSVDAPNDDEADGAPNDQ